MLAPVINVDGHQIGIHKTFLKPDGSGKWPFSDKCLQRETCGPIRGGAVRLAPCDPGRGLAIAEGIETAASVTQLFDVPAWVALSAPGLAALELPPSICSILICADHDAVGLEAALTAKTRWLSEGRKARLRWPRQAGDDFNDILRRGC